MDKGGSLKGHGAGHPDESGPNTSGTSNGPKSRGEVQNHPIKPATRYHPYQHHASRTPPNLGTSVSKSHRPSYTPNFPLISSSVSVSKANATAKNQPYPQEIIKYLRDKVHDDIMIWYDKTKLVWNHCNDERVWDDSSKTQAGRGPHEEGDRLRMSTAYEHDGLMKDLEKLHQAYAEALACKADQREDDPAGSKEVEKTMSFQEMILRLVEHDRIRESAAKRDSARLAPAKVPE